MKASRLLAFGDTSQLTVQDIPQPVPSAGEVLVKVAASSALALGIRLALAPRHAAIAGARRRFELSSRSMQPDGGIHA